jgi:hypothetical protein
MKTRDELLMVAGALLVLWLLTRRPAAAARTGGGVVVDPYAQRIDSAVHGVQTLVDIGTSLFGGGGGGGYPTGVTQYNPNALADPTMGSGPVILDD